MRVAFAGDWHANTGWACRAIDYAKEQGAETIVHLGDYGYTFTRSFRDGVEAALTRVGLTLLFVDGNHDNHEWLNALPVGEDGVRRITDRVHHLPRGYRWEWDGVRFLALGGAFSVDRRRRTLGESWWAGETITDDDVARAIAGGPADVLVSHDCPSGVHIPGLERGALLFPADALAQSDEHRKRLREVVDAVQPVSVWHGHYHVPYETTADFGYGPVQVHGLDCDGTSLHANVVVVDTAELAPVGEEVQRGEKSLARPARRGDRRTVAAPGAGTLLKA